MKLSAILPLVMVTGCAVDSATTSEQQQAVGGQPGVLARFRMTGAGAAFVGSTQGAPWSIQYIAIDRYVTDAVPPPGNVGFGGGWQDPDSLFLGPYGYYYAAGYADYAYGELPPGSVQLSSQQAKVRATVPENSDTFYSERCYYDNRIGSYDCVSLAGETIDVTWDITGEQDVVNGRHEIDMGNIALVISGRSTFSLAHASGTLVGSPLANELESYITADRGAGVWVEATH